MFRTQIRMKMKSNLCWIAVAALLSMLCVGCGSSSSNSMSNNAMSAAQAQAVSAQVALALTQALGTVNPDGAADVHKNLSAAVSAAVRDIRPETSTGCTSTSTGQNCNFPISLPDYPCVSPGGGQEGSISVSGDIDGTLNNAGGGALSGQFTITPTNCSVSNLLVNGDPSISVAGQINFTNTAITFPVVFTETGGLSYGPNPSGSCQVNATYTINAQLACTVTGTVCGQPVNGTC
jgi:hypothetical protein